MAEEVFANFEKEQTVPSVEEFRQAYLSALGKTPTTKEENEFFSVYEKFITSEGRINNWTISTYQKFNALKSKFEEFKENLTFDDFDETGLQEYIIFLRDEKNHRNSTIKKQLGFLKWFLRWATIKGYNNNKAFENFTLNLKETTKKVIFLTWEELMTVYSFEFSENQQSIARVRDIFCFCCFTSLRYSDVANLLKSDIKNNYIEIVTVKTSDSLKIELNKYSKSILDKYKDCYIENYKALPVISNQKMNYQLKEMGKICQIDDPIRITFFQGNKRIDEIHPKYALLGTHAGRRTFICNALMLGIPANIVMKWTGHSDYKAMKPYIDISDRAKEDAMSLFDKR